MRKYWLLGLSCGIFLLLGLARAHAQEQSDVPELFSQSDEEGSLSNEGTEVETTILPATPGTANERLPRESGIKKTILREPRNRDLLRKPRVQPEEVDLTRYGEGIFTLSPDNFAPTQVVPVGPDYVLGPNDQLIIDVWGMVDGHYQVAINREGCIVLPKIGQLSLAGLTFQEAERLLREKLRTFYSGFEMSISLGKLRMMRVFVLGEVKHPGAYVVPSTATLLHALSMAGGPSTTGTMRNIQLIRNNQTFGVNDLYHFLLTGKKDQDYRLQAEDTVFVPFSGPIVTLRGTVKRPAKYELKAEQKLSDLLVLAGGAQAGSYGGRIQVERVDPYNKRIMLDLREMSDLFAGRGQAQDIVLQDSDIIRIFPIYLRIDNKVSIVGSVKYPGDYEVKENMRVKDILAEAQLLPEAYLQKAELARINTQTMENKVFPFAPVDALRGDSTSNMLLQNLDAITIYSQLRQSESLTLRGEVTIPGKFTIERQERLSSLLHRADGFTREAFLRGAVFTRESVKVAQMKHLTQFVRMQNELILKSSLGGTSGTDAAEVMKQQQLLATLTTALASPGRISIRLRDLALFENSPDDLVLEDSDLLYIPRPPMTVQVIGAVKNQGAIIWSEGLPLNYYIARSGGFTGTADAANIFVIQADGSSVPLDGGSPVDRTTKASQSLSAFVTNRSRGTGRIIEQGDTIIVPSKIVTNRWQLTKDIINMFYQIALPIAVYRP